MSREQWGHGYSKGFAAGIAAKASFYEYVKEYAPEEESPVGDFISDVRADDSFPVTNNRLEILKYLYGKSACIECIDAFKECFKNWERLSQ